GRYLGEAAEHHVALRFACAEHRDDAGLERGDHGRMARQHAEVAFEARNVDLLHLAREHELGGRDEIEVECRHGRQPQAASAASFLPFSTASSIAPTM